MAPRHPDVAVAQADSLVAEVNRRLGDMRVRALAPAFADRRWGEEDDEGEPVTAEELLCLAYGRGDGDADAIHVVASYANYYDVETRPDDFEFAGVEYVPWSSCDREDRLKAIATLPALLDEIVKEVDENLAVARRDAEAVRGLVGAAAD
jgi:hypothetical protein